MLNHEIPGPDLKKKKKKKQVFIINKRVSEGNEGDVFSPRKKKELSAFTTC